MNITLLSKNNFKILLLVPLRWLLEASDSSNSMELTSVKLEFYYRTRT
jgi:hypothetical protein